MMINVALYYDYYNNNDSYFSFRYYRIGSSSKKLVSKIS